MRTQKLTPSNNEAIYIGTPMGVITLTHVVKKRWELTLPDGVRAFKSKALAVINSPFLSDDKGVVTPAYKMLVPKKTADGTLVGCTEPSKLRLAAKE